MPIARFQTPDGRIARFEVPEGTTPEAAEAMMAQEFPNLSPPENTVTAPKKNLAGAIGYVVGRSPKARLLMGATSVLSAPFQLGANIGDVSAEAMGMDPVVGKTVNEKLARLESGKRLGMAARTGNPVGEDWDVAGGLGSLVPGVAAYKSIAKALPKSVSETAKTLTGRTVGRATAGGGTAALTIPDTSGGEDYLQNKGIQTGIGAAVPVGMATVGSILKGIGKVGGQSYRALRDSMRNFTDRGTTKLSEEHLRELAAKGGEPALKKTIGSLFNEKPIIGKLTSADAIAAGNIGKPERFGGPLVRLEAELGSLPETTTLLQSLKVAKEEARKTALKKISGTPAERAAAKAQLEKASASYEAIKTRIVESDSTLEKLSTSPAFRGAEKYAAENIANSNAARSANGLAPIPFKQTVEVGDKTITRYSADGLQQIKQALDDMTSNPTMASGLGVTGTGKAHIKPVKETLMNWMNKNVKDWEFTRASYRDAKTIQNRQKAGDVLEDVLTSAKDEEKVGAWLQAQRNLPETLKTKLKQGKTYAVEFLPEQKKILDDITKELQRDAKVSQMTREVNIPGATTVVSGKTAQLVSPLYRPTMIANWFIKRGSEEGNEVVNRKTAEILASPPKLLEILSKTPTKFHGQIKDALQDFANYAKDPANVAAIQAVNE